MKNKSFIEKWEECAGYILALFLITAAAWYISGYHYQLMMIQGDSMSPFYHHLQLVVLDKHPEELSYGDVVAFQCDGLDAVLVKRVVACPGDTVQIEDGVLLVNGAISTVYGQDVVFEYAGIAEKEIFLGEGQYFVIGDNAAESRDSRYEEVGGVFADSVIGRVIE